LTEIGAIECKRSSYVADASSRGASIAKQLTAMLRDDDWRFMMSNLIRYIATDRLRFLLFFYEAFTSIYACDVTTELKLTFLIFVDQTIDKDIIGSSRSVRYFAERSSARRTEDVFGSVALNTAARNVLRHL